MYHKQWKISELGFVGEELGGLKLNFLLNINHVGWIKPISIHYGHKYHPKWVQVWLLLTMKV